MSRRAFSDLLADIDRVLDGRWLTIVDIIDRLTDSPNRNPAVTGRFESPICEENFCRYARRMQGLRYTYPDVAEALMRHGYRQSTTVGWCDRDRRPVGDLLVWGSR